jgi:16S rRNA (cytosine967-C5)-methyltransferase
MSLAHLESRKKHAARLWLEYTDAQGPRQLDKWIAQRLKVEKKFGSQDRKFYSNALFSIARHIHTYLFRSHCFRQFGLQSLSNFRDLDRKTMVRVLDSFARESADESASWALVRSVPPHDLLDFVFSVSDAQSSNECELSDFQKQTESLFIASGCHASEPDFVYLSVLLLAYGIPVAWAEQVAQRARKSAWDVQTTFAFICGQNERAPLWIRINHVDKKSLVEQDLLSHGLKLSWMSELAASVEGSFGLYQASSFKSGFFEIQDLASQQIAASVRARPGEKIWDACAGGGGKTVALASDLRGKGALYATDVREFKLDEVKRRTLRAGFHNVRTMAWDASGELKAGIEVERQAGFDAVLIDAPCSSSGTWRRNPDARLRVSTSAARSELIALQKKILTQASIQVRPGGRLVYATCSWCVDENEGVVQAFLDEAGKEFAQSTTTQEGLLLGHPAQDSDTMFVAVFDRSSDI